MPAKISHKCVTSAHKATAFRKKKEKHSFGTLNESLGLTSGDFVLRFREFEENLLFFFWKNKVKVTIHKTENINKHVLRLKKQKQMAPSGDD